MRACEEFMETSILSKFLPKTEEKQDYFLTLEICQEKVKTAACAIKNGEVEILGLGSANFTGGWEEMTLVVDEALSQVEGKFPPDMEVNKVVLGLPSEYTKDGKIEDSYLTNLKELLKKLSLTPLGFVEIPLAVIHYLQKQEGGPQTLILVRVGNQLSISLVRVGKITNTLSIPKTESVTQDLEKAMATFVGVEVLPSRILLYDGGDLEKTKQELINHPWLARAPFLHFPKIESAPLDLDIKAVAFAGASEMAQVVEVTEAKEPTAAPNETADFGFVKNQDILEFQPPKEKPLTAVINEPATPPAPPPMATSSRRFSLPKLRLPHLPQLSRLLTFLRLRTGLAILMAAILLLLFSAGIVAAYWYLPSAQVNLLLSAQNKEQPLEIIINPKLTSLNEATKEVPGLKVEIDEKETKKVPTTGKKTIGDPAKGQVTIYNGTSSSKTFDKGTVITAPNNLKFSLNDNVTIASKSGDLTDLRPGKADVNVTAVAIGPEGNLGVGQIFSLASFSTDDFMAKNSVAFSGGTSRQISVVARSDQEGMMATATSELTEQAKKDSGGKLNTGEKIIEDTLAGEVTSKKFSKGIDEEATELSLDLGMHFTALAYRESDLTNLLEKSMAASIPAGFDFKKETVKMEVTDLTKKKDGTMVMKANFSVSLLPRLNIDEIKKNLTGKDLKTADNYLRSLGNVAGYEINFTRKLPFFNKNLPHIEKNISIATEGHK